MHYRVKKSFLIIASLLALFSAPTFAAPGLDLTSSGIGYFSLALFIFAYLLVMGEEFLQLRKSKPVLIAAGIIWMLIGWEYTNSGIPEQSESAFRHTLLEYAELLLFLLVAMTYINAMEERNIFDSMRAWMIRKGFSYKTLFWLTGFLAFFISPIADNLTTALLMCAVVLKVGGDNKHFVNLSCINIVVAANSGGAFSPFGDITTLMVWQAGRVPFNDFFLLFIPSLVNFVVPALFMSFFIPNKKPDILNEEVLLKRGALRIVALFLLTIATAVCCHSFLHLPPVLGMMTGLGYLQFFSFYLRRTQSRSLARTSKRDIKALRRMGDVVPFDVFSKIARAEWDTLLFFYGVVMCVGGLGFIGYLALASEALYTNLGATTTNIILGVASAIIDNIPIMFAVLNMHPDMSVGNWLLITLTAGVGGSMLSIGSAAGVALMGQAHGKYTFIGHLKWTPVIVLGYAASIAVHMWMNASLF